MNLLALIRVSLHSSLNPGTDFGDRLAMGIARAVALSIALIKGSTLVYIAPPPFGICVEGLFGKLLQKPFL